MNLYKKIIYYLIIILMFLSIKPIIDLVKIDDSKISEIEILKIENNRLKEEIKEISEIEYNDYNYVIGKIIYKDIYDSNKYYIKCNNELDKGLAVINNKGLIGITDELNIVNNIDKVSLSIVSNYKIGEYKNGYGYFSNEVNIGDLVYTSGLTKIPPYLYVGIIKEVNIIDNKYVGKIELVNNDTNYVLILTEYGR